MQLLNENPANLRRKELLSGKTEVIRNIYPNKRILLSINRKLDFKHILLSIVLNIRINLINCKLVIADQPNIPVGN
jgi:hypothetical protein